MNDDGAVSNFSSNSASLKLQQKITSKTAANGRKDVEIMVPLKYLSDFLRTLGMSLINCEFNLILTLSEKFVLSNDTKTRTFVITDTELYVPVVTLSNQDYAKLLQQLKSSFYRTINWNKYRSKLSIQRPNPYLDFLIS